MIDTLYKLLQIMKTHGAIRFYAKKLSPNDNSKNQIYLGGDFSALNIIPYKSISTDSNDLAGSVRDRAKADITFYWVDENGKYEAPKAQLILYPNYPEVRMSGFLKGCIKAPSKIMTVRDEGRILFIGITPDGSVLGYAAGVDDPVSKEFSNNDSWKPIGVFLQIPADLETNVSTKEQLLSTLKNIYQKNWISSQKLDSSGIGKPYQARNGGGYTLEAELGISPNSYSEPDYLGWEIKQYGVSNFETYRAKSPVTLMTPEPTGGYYVNEGVTEFINRFGYPDKNGVADRINFGGIYTCDKGFHKDTGLRLALTGFSSMGKITDMNGGIVLLSHDDEVAALWSFTGVMSHWNRKHAQAAYIPSIYQTPPPEYAYGPKVILCEGTDFTLFLKAIAKGQIYYDPGIKMENATSSKPKVKRRSQFRIKHRELTNIYHDNEIINLQTI